jgi:hypothetical protein
MFKAMPGLQKMVKSIAVLDSTGRPIRKFNSKTGANEFKKLLEGRYHDTFSVAENIKGVSFKYKANGDRCKGVFAKDKRHLH